MKGTLPIPSVDQTITNYLGHVFEKESEDEKEK